MAELAPGPPRADAQEFDEEAELLDENGGVARRMSLSRTRPGCRVKVPIRPITLLKRGLHHLGSGRLGGTRREQLGDKLGEALGLLAQQVVAGLAVEQVRRLADTHPDKGIANQVEMLEDGRIKDDSHEEWGDLCCHHEVAQLAARSGPDSTSTKVETVSRNRVWGSKTAASAVRSIGTSKAQDIF